VSADTLLKRGPWTRREKEESPTGRDPFARPSEPRCRRTGQARKVADTRSRGADRARKIRVIECRSVRAFGALRSSADRHVCPRPTTDERRSVAEWYRNR
jgi:hypothetical protein